MKTVILGVVSVASLILISPSAVWAAQLTSAGFSFAFGATETTGPGGLNNLNPWSKTENLGTNSPETQGAFTLSPAPNGPGFTGTGPTFPGRVLTTGGAGHVVAYIGASDGQNGNTQPSFIVPITGSYSGPAPVDAHPIAPNYQLSIEITGISIYAGAHPASPIFTAEWTETTPGHLQVSPAVNLGAGSADYANAAVYTKLAFDPTDYAVPLSGANESFTRIFDILPSDTSDLRYADGLEISGRVVLTYVAVPEPSSLALGAIGLLGWVSYLRRRSA